VAFRSIATLRPDAGAPVAAPLVAVGPADLNLALRRLQDALAASDPDATATALAALAGLQLPEAVGPDIQRVRELADGYAFDDAGEIVARLLDRIKTESTS
jgi:hypothetical protein